MIKERKPEHILIASSSSVYGYTDNMPFNENQKVIFNYLSMVQQKKH